MSFLWEELKRRHVIKVAVAYGAVGWLLIKAASEVLPIFAVPPWVLPTVTFIIILGFPLAIVLSWIFDLTPQGIIQTESNGVSASTTNVRGRKLVLIIAGALVIVLGIVVFDKYVRVYTPDKESDVTAALPSSIAVLPFDNLSPDPDHAYFSAGLHEEILTQLAQLQNLRVISRTSVLRYGKSDLSIPEIAKELNVETIMEGSVQYANGRVHINMQLIDAVRDEHLWSRTYDRDFTDIFAIQSDIATNAANALRTEFSLTEQEDLKRAPTESPEAYRLYLAARQSQLGDNIRLDLLHQAVEADPGFALPYVERASIYIQRLRTPGTATNPLDQRAEQEELAREDINKALEIDPTLGRAYAWLGMIHRYNWRGHDARNAFERALEFSPNDPDVLVNYGYFLVNIGQQEQAIGLAERAVELDPYNSETHAALGQFNAAAGHFDRAADDFRKAAELGAIWVHMLAANLELVRGNQPEAASQLLLSDPVAMTTTVPQWPAHTAYSYARLNLDQDAARFLARFDELATEQHVPAAADILSHLARGEEEKALQRLEEAAAEKAPYEAFNLLMSIVANTFKDPVLDKPAFADARHKLEFTGLSRPPPPPPHAGPEHRGRHPGPPPPQAIEACTGLSEGDACSFSAPHGKVEGSCIIPPEFETILVCAPRGAPGLDRVRPD